MRLDGRVAAVVGPGSEISHAAIRRLQADGAIVLAVVDEAADQQDVSTTHLHTADLSSAEGARSVAVLCNERWGRLDILFYAASAIDDGHHEAAEHVSERSDWERVYEANVWGPMVFGRTLLPMLGQVGGSIVFLSSIDGVFGNPSFPAYSTSKAALGVLTHVLACDAAQSGVRVNTVATAAISQFAPGAPGPSLDAGSFDRVLAATPLRRAPTPDDIAGVVSFLASDDSAYVTGTVIAVDGGRTAGTPGTLH